MNQKSKKSHYELTCTFYIFIHPSNTRSTYWYDNWHEYILGHSSLYHLSMNCSLCSRNFFENRIKSPMVTKISLLGTDPYVWPTGSCSDKYETHARTHTITHKGGRNIELTDFVDYHPNVLICCHQQNWYLLTWQSEFSSSSMQIWLWNLESNWFVGCQPGVSDRPLMRALFLH
jgi:hypothetical protein